MLIKFFISIFILCITTVIFALENTELTFRKAKILAKESVYFDRAHHGDFYCGCTWDWRGASGGVVDLSSCGYEARKQVRRALRLEWEHVVTAWSMAHQLQCWEEGKRTKCRDSSDLFNDMESNLFNLVPSVGEVNGDRSNFRFAMIPGEATQYGACDAETDFKGRKFEPRPEVRGEIARINFYIHDHYNLQMSKSQQQLFMAWDKQYPVSLWEKTRHDRIAKLMGHENPYVTGDKVWTLRKGSASQVVLKSQSKLSQTQPAAPLARFEKRDLVLGNSRSKIYHLPIGCPSYGKSSKRNTVEFINEQAAINEGYKKAKNCR